MQAAAGASVVVTMSKDSTRFVVSVLNNESGAARHQPAAARAGGRACAASRMANAAAPSCMNSHAIHPSHTHLASRVSAQHFTHALVHRHHLWVQPRRHKLVAIPAATGAAAGGAGAQSAVCNDTAHACRPSTAGLFPTGGRVCRGRAVAGSTALPPAGDAQPPAAHSCRSATSAGRQWPWWGCPCRTQGLLGGSQLLSSGLRTCSRSQPPPA